jgi:hypothetical protein
VHDEACLEPKNVLLRMLLSSNLKSKFSSLSR